MNASLLLVIGCISLPLPAAAGIYQWVDEQGRVHFGDAPPAGAAPREIGVDPGPAAEERERAQRRTQRLLREQAERRARRLEGRAKRRAARAVEAEQAAAREGRCRLARENLRVLLIRRPVYWNDGEGQRVYLEDARRSEEIQREREEIRRFCDPGS